MRLELLIIVILFVFARNLRFSNVCNVNYGAFDSEDKAREALPAVRKKFPEAFVVGIEGNKVIRVKNK